MGRKVKSFSSSQLAGLDSQVNDWITDNPTVVPINVSLDTPHQNEFLMSVLYEDTSVAVAIKQALDEFHMRGTNHEKISI